MKKSKINLGKVKECLDMVCAKCGHRIPPEGIRRIDFEKVKCPACGETFVPQKLTIKRPGE